MPPADAFLRLRARRRAAGVVLLFGLLVTFGSLVGCAGSVPPPHIIRHRVDDFRDGVRLEQAHKTTIDDDFQLRNQIAADRTREAARTAAYWTKQDFVLFGREVKRLGQTARSRVAGVFGY